MTSTHTDSRRVLVVDDQLTSRTKLRLAVENLGCIAETADGGKSAIELLDRESFDLVLLDIMMPDVDGFDVLRHMKSRSRLAHIPVLVVSGLESEMDSVVKAIELGAADFLPKDFDQILFNTRVNTSLEQKRHRDSELEYLRELRKLTDAAKVLQHGRFNPDRLHLKGLRNRDDALGALATVFGDMAREIYDRERRYRQKIRTLQGAGILLVIGLVHGLSVPVSRLTASIEPHPFGITLWVNVICAVICLGIAAVRGTVPRLNPQSIRLFVIWGFLGTLIGGALLYRVAEDLTASVISIIIVLEGFIVFAISAVLKTENASAKRLIGLTIGLIGVALIVFTNDEFRGIGNRIWALVALALPIGYAIRSMYVATHMPSKMDLIGATGMAHVAGALLVLPFAAYFDDFVGIGAPADKVTLLIILLALVAAVSTVLRVYLIRSAGAVFASQAGFIVAFAGILWSIVLLNESLPAVSWAAFALMLVGLWLVEPVREAELEPPKVIDGKVVCAAAADQTNPPQPD